MSNLSNINNNFIVDDDGKILIGLTLASGASILQVTGDSKFVGIVDATNFKINGAQGTNGQILTSTGSGVGWEDNAGDTVFEGATSTDDGTSGAVPQPLAADYLKFLRGDATWATVSLPNDFIPSTAGAAGTSGLVPAPAAGTQDGTYFLNGDGSFGVPPYPAQENDFLTSLNFNTTDGILTAGVQNQTNVLVDLDGRYLLLSGGSLTGDLQVTNEITVNKTNVNTPGKITINGNTDATLQLKSEDTALAANETLGIIEFYGSDGTAPGAGVKSSIRARNGDQVGGSGDKSNLIFAVSDGATNNNEALRINPTGSIAIDGATKYGTSGQILTSAGDAPPTWEDASVSGVTSVAALTLGTTGTDLSSTVADPSGDAVITLQVPSASASNRGALTAADWTTFNSKTSNTGTVTGTGTAGTVTQWKTGGIGIEDGPIVFTPPVAGGNTGETTYFTSAVPGLSVFHGRLNISNIPDGGNGLVLSAVTDKEPQITFRNTSALAVIQASDNKALLFYTGGQTASDVALTLDDSQDASFGGDITVTGELTVSGTGQSSFGGQVTVPTTPSAATDAASKSYVLSQVGGLGTFQGGYDATTDPGSPVLTGASNIAIGQGDFYTVTVGGDITFSDTPTGDATLEPGDFIFASTDIGAGTDPASTEFTLVLADQNIAGAGSTDANTAKGIAGFNSLQFSVSNTGWVQSKISTATVSGLSRITAGTGITTSYAADGAITVTNSSTDTGTPAILSNGTSPTLNTGISATEVRTLIGAGTGNSNLAIGNTSTTAMAGNTTTISAAQASAITANTAKVSDTGIPAVLTDGANPGVTSLYSNTTAAAVRATIGAGTGDGDGTVTSVGGTGSVSGLTLTGTVTTSGNLTLGGSISGFTPLNDIRSLGVPAFTNGTNPNITTAQVMAEIEADGGFDSFSSVFKTSWSYAGNYNLTDAGDFTETAGSSWITWTDDSSDTTRGNITALAIAPTTGGSAGGVFIYNDQGSGYAPGWRQVWTSTTDGAGSGLDADLLDGQQGAYYLDYDNFTNKPTIPSVGNGQIDGRTSGLGLSGSMDATANQSGNTTFTVTSNAATAATASTITYRDSSADINVRLLRANYANQSTISGAMAFRVNNSSDNYTRYCSSPSAIRSFLGVPSSGDLGSYLPLAGGTMSGTITMGTQNFAVAGNYGRGVFGLYDASKYQHVWSMGAAYKLADNGASTGTGGNLYGLAWSYNPDYGAVGNNAQSKAGLGHQLLLMENGTTTFAAGQGMWTSGNITFGDGHFLGDDSDDNLLLSSSINENLIVRAGVGLRFEVDGNASPADLALNIDNAMSATFGGYVYIPTYLFHTGDTNTRIGFTSGTVTVRGDTSILLDGPVTANSTMTVSSTLTTNGQITANSSIYLKNQITLPASGLSNISGRPAYAIYQEGGAWTYPYPDLCIAMHTGLKFGANASYQGMRFYNDYTMATQVMSINNGSDPLGANNVYVNNNLQAGSSLRAPIFYDSNNTAYYGDFAGSSLFNQLNIGSSNTNYGLFCSTAISGTNIYANSSGGSFIFGASSSEGEYISRPGGTNDVIVVAGSSERLRVKGTGALEFTSYTATNTSSTPTTGVAPVQNFNPAGGVMSDTTSDLGTMANGDIVRTAQEATFEYTRAEMNALPTGNNGGRILLNAPGSNKFVIVEKATFLIYYSYNGTTVSTNQRYEIQQDSNDPNNADLVAFMTGETVNAIVYASGAASGYNYGTYENDTGRSTLNRTYRPNKATTFRRISSSYSLATSVISVRIKLRYRVWDATTF